MAHRDPRLNTSLRSTGRSPSPAKGARATPLHSRTPSEKVPSPSRHPSSPSPSHRSGKKNSEPQFTDEVSEYIERCANNGTDPVREFTAALSDPSIRNCNLSLRSTPLAPKDLACIAESLRNNLTIRELNLSNNRLADTSAADLAAALRDNRGLETLILSNNEITSEGILRVATALKDNTQLSDLQLQSNLIGNHGAAVLAQALVTNTALAKLDLQHNKVKDRGVVALASILKVNEFLRVLNFRFNEVGEDGAEALGNALKENATLEDLDLAGNLIGVKGARAIADGLALNTALKKLNLRSNSIADEGAAAIAEALTKNNSLTELHLGSNSIESSGVVAIAESLKFNHTLRKLDLQGVRMGSSGALAIADALRSNETLSELILELDKATTQEVREIASAVQTNTGLLEFKMGDHSRIDEASLSVILATLSLNKLVRELLDRAGFKEHFQKNARKFRNALDSGIRNRPNIDISQLVSLLSAKVIDLQKREEEGSLSATDYQRELEKLLQQASASPTRQTSAPASASKPKRDISSSVAQSYPSYSPDTNGQSVRRNESRAHNSLPAQQNGSDLHRRSSSPIDQHWEQVGEAPVHREGPSSPPGTPGFDVRETKATHPTDNRPQGSVRGQGVRDQQGHGRVTEARKEESRAYEERRGQRSYEGQREPQAYTKEPESESQRSELRGHGQSQHEVYVADSQRGQEYRSSAQKQHEEYAQADSRQQQVNNRSQSQPSQQQIPSSQLYSQAPAQNQQSAARSRDVRAQEIRAQELQRDDEPASRGSVDVDRSVFNSSSASLRGETTQAQQAARASPSKQGRANFSPNAAARENLAKRRTELENDLRSEYLRPGSILLEVEEKLSQKLDAMGASIEARLDQWKREYREHLVPIIEGNVNRILGSSVHPEIERVRREGEERERVIREDYITKIHDYQERMHTDQTTMMEKVREDEETLKKETEHKLDSLRGELIRNLADFEEDTQRDQGKLRKEILEALDKSSKNSTRIQQHQEELLEQDERIRQLEDIANLQHEVLEDAKEKVHYFEQNLARTFGVMATETDLGRRASQLDARINQLEERLLAEERAKEYLSSSRLETFTDRLAQVEKALKVINSQVKSPSKNDATIRAMVEHEVASRTADLQAQMKQERERHDKRLSELLQRLAIIEEALKSEQETSIQALQALLSE